MEITRDALLRIVKAARAATRLAEDMNKLLISQGRDTWADFIEGELADALCEFGGEVLEPHQDFIRDSHTMALLTDPDLSDEEVTAAFIGMHRAHHPEQPKPHFISRDEMQKQANAGYGYSAPEVKLK